MKPITWFPPMWAYACGAVSVGAAGWERWPYVLGGVILAGPVVCGASQAVNDWYDRHVDAINEPNRVIPSGRMPGDWGFRIAVALSLVALPLALALGIWVLAATLVGLAAAWAYSAPPLRFKANGWLGAATVGLSYETLPWLTAAAAALGGAPSGPVIAVALFYGIGALGILGLNDFKAIEGDRRMGVQSLPVQFGVEGAARLCCAVIGFAQLWVLAILIGVGALWAAGLLIALMAAQGAAMRRFLADPAGRAVWYSAVGVGLYVLGMMASAVALSGATGG